MAASNVIEFPRRRHTAKALTCGSDAAVAFLAEHRNRRTGYPDGWPEGETGRKMEELAVDAFEHSIKAGRRDTMKAARARTMNMVNSLQAYFEERRNEQG